MQTDELEEYLDSLQRDARYRVDAVLKESVHETTQRVTLVCDDESEQGLYVRKYIKRGLGMGAAYGRICEAQKNGRRFRYIPHVVDCYTTGEDDVVIMEYVQGEMLHDAVLRCGASFALAADVFPRLCDAVSELHEGFDAPIIHRDLKPSNVMIARDSLKVIDLGIARFYREGARDDTRHFGTRSYAPPEQFGFGQTTVRSDVYALGMLLFFCLTGRDPGPDARDEGFCDPRIPEPVRAVLLGATQFDPAHRYADVRALRAAFCRAAAACGHGSIASAGKPSHQAPPSQVVALQPKVRVFEKPRPRAAMHAVFERIPTPVGVAWNALLAFVAGVLLTGCVWAVFVPNQTDAAYPLWFRIVEYGAFAAANIVFAAYALMDKRRLYARFPRWLRIAPRRIAAGAAAYFAASLLAVSLLMAMVSQGLVR